MKQLFLLFAFFALTYSLPVCAKISKLETEIFNGQSLITVNANTDDALRNFLAQDYLPFVKNESYLTATLNSFVLGDALVGIFGPIFYAIPGENEGPYVVSKQVVLNKKLLSLIDHFENTNSQYWLDNGGRNVAAYQHWGMLAYDMHHYLKNILLDLQVPAYDKLAAQFNMMNYLASAIPLEKIHEQILTSLKSGLPPILEFGIYAKANGDYTGVHAVTVLGISEIIDRSNASKSKLLLKIFDQLQKTIVYVEISQASQQPEMIQFDILSPLNVYNSQFNRRLQTLMGLFPIYGDL